VFLLSQPVYDVLYIRGRGYLTRVSTVLALLFTSTYEILSVPFTDTNLRELTLWKQVFVEFRFSLLYNGELLVKFRSEIPKYYYSS
jgi:hypothetical protein